MMTSYAHFDIEADGPSPASSNMISIAIVLTDSTGVVLDELLCDILPRPGYEGDVSTLAWWQSDQNRAKEYKRILENGVPAAEAMKRIHNKFQEWKKVSRVMWVARPAAYDWMWLKCYSDQYQPPNEPKLDIGFKAICASTMVDIWKVQKGISTADADIRFKEWGKELKITHNALDDAHFQARIFHCLQNELTPAKN